MREIKAFHGRAAAPLSRPIHRSSSSSDDWRTHYHLTAAEAQASIHLIHSVWSIKHLINESPNFTVFLISHNECILRRKRREMLADFMLKMVSVLYKRIGPIIILRRVSMIVFPATGHL